MKSFKIYTLHEAAKKAKKKGPTARERANAAGRLFVTKDLAPSKIDTLTTDKEISGRMIEKQVKSFWDTQTKYNMSKEQTDYMKNLLGSIKSVGANSSMNVGVPPFEPKDVAQIAKDYGEVLAGLWLTTSNWGSGTGVVNYPAANSYPVADILCPDNEGGVDLVSIKTKKGSPTSFKGIWDLVQESQNLWIFLSKEQQEMIEIIKRIMGFTVFAHPIEVAKYLYDEWDMPGIGGQDFGLLVLMRIIGERRVSSITDQKIEDWIRGVWETKKGEDKEFPELGGEALVRKKLEPFYSSIGKGVGADEWGKKFEGQKNKSLKIQSPLAYFIVDWLNELYSEHLTSLLQTFRNIIQVNVDLDMKGKLSVNVKEFREIDFIFSNAGNSTAGRNKIGFKKGK
jgi:hypothetical protein